MFYSILSYFDLIVAIRTGLEPATSAVTGRHSNQLNYRISCPTNQENYRRLLWLQKYNNNPELQILIKKKRFSIGKAFIFNCINFL